MPGSVPTEPPAQHRQILALAVPAFVTLIAEPLFLLADNAIIGYLGTEPLAALGVASTILLTAVGVFVFLAYGSTAVVARRAGAGDTAGAIGAGVDGMYLAALLGAITAVGIVLTAAPLVDFFDTSPQVADEAVTYVSISAYGIPPILIVLAATGVLRGLLDTRTPLIVATFGFSANAALSLLFVHGLEFGIAGAAWGTVIAQSGMAIALSAVVLRDAAKVGASRTFHPGGVLSAALGGIPLIIRTLSLRATVIATTWVAASLGDAGLAAFTVSMTVWSLLVFALDALAIAAQAITGTYLGAADIDRTRQALSTLLRWAIWFGFALTVLILALHRVIPLGFSADAHVRSAIAAALIVIALSQPIAGIAFVLDGVLMGAGDAWWLALAQTALFIAYLPLLYAVWATGIDGTAGLVWLWIAFCAFMALRAAVFVLRSRSDAWMITGATLTTTTPGGHVKIGIIVGSTRRGRLGGDVGQWVHHHASQRNDAEYEIVDLMDFDLPLLQEPVPPAGADRHYETPQTKHWGAKIDEFDGFVWVTPEYNHSVPAAMKNALDVLYPEWTNKTVGFVSYGGDGGVRSVEHWRPVMANVRMHAVRAQVALSLATDTADGAFSPGEDRPAALTAMLDQLVELTAATASLRQ